MDLLLDRVLEIENTYRILRIVIFIIVVIIKREASVFATSAPQEIGILGSVIPVFWLGSNSFQVSFFRAPIVFPHHPQKLGILAQS